MCKLPGSTRIFLLQIVFVHWNSLSMLLSCGCLDLAVAISCSYAFAVHYIATLFAFLPCTVRKTLCKLPMETLSPSALYGTLKIFGPAIINNAFIHLFAQKQAKNAMQGCRVCHCYTFICAFLFLCISNAFLLFHHSSCSIYVLISKCFAHTEQLLLPFVAHRMMSK